MRIIKTILKCLLVATIISFCNGYQYETDDAVVIEGAKNTLQILILCKMQRIVEKVLKKSLQQRLLEQKTSTTKSDEPDFSQKFPQNSSFQKHFRLKVLFERVHIVYFVRKMNENEQFAVQKKWNVCNFRLAPK